MKRDTLFSFLLCLCFVSACTQTGSMSGTITVEPTSSMSATVTVEPTSTPLSINPPERPDFEKGEGGEYTQEQKSSIERGDFKRMEEILANWWQYWGNAENRPFHPETKPTFTYFWDKDGKSGSVLLQPGGEYGSRSFYMPILNGIYLYVPPKPGSESYKFQPGMGPLELTGGDYVLTWKQGDWARVNENGDIVERVDMETARWKRERFGELLPETLQECAMRNVIHQSTIQEDLKKITEKIEKNEIDPSRVSEFSTLIPSLDPKEEKTPGFVTLNIVNRGNVPIDACASLELQSGKKFIVYVIPIKKTKSDAVGHLFFAKDSEAIKSLVIQRTGSYDYNEDEAYVHLKEGTWKKLFISPVFWRGYAERGGIWDPLLSLIPESSDRANEISFKLSLLLGDQTIDPKTGDWVSIQEYGEERLLSELGQEILPTVSIGVIY